MASDLAADTLVICSPGAAVPAWAESVGGLTIPASRLDDDDAAGALLRAVGCVLLDADGSRFIPIARRIHSVDPALQVVAVDSPQSRQLVRRALLYSPGLGEVWIASALEVTAALSARAAGVTRQRRRYERTRQRVEIQRMTASPQRTERALISDAYLAGLLRVLPDAVFSVDASGDILFANAAALMLFGTAEREIIGMSLDAALSRESNHEDRGVSLLERAVRDGNVEIAFRSASGDKRTGEIHAAEMAVSNARVWAVVLHDTTLEQAMLEQMRDTAAELEAANEELQVASEELEERTEIAERERADADDARQEAEAANLAKGEFLAVMSHELRTPLNAIGGYAELLEIGIHGAVTSDQREAIARIQHSQRHLLGLINGVLNFAKMDAGAVEYAYERVPLDEVVATCEALIAPQARAKGLTLTNNACEHGLASMADREKVQQIVLNLLSNALKFTERGGRIALSCKAIGDSVRVQVTDSGVGIAPDQVERMFQPFVQLDSTLTRTKEGTGLGLAISRDLARGMGGELTAVSTVGVGSTFTLTLPAAFDASGGGAR